MHSVLFSVRLPRAIAFLVLTAFAVALSGQATARSTEKVTPPKIEKQIMVFPESVVLQQWTHTLKLVNAPQNLSLLNPCQCIRIGLVANGDGRDTYLENTQLTFRVEFDGKGSEHALAPLAAIKQVKPEGGDFVTEALSVIGKENPFPTMASLGASNDGWCVPTDAKDGTASIDAEIETPSGHQKQTRTTIRIESVETGRKRTFKDTQDVSQFLMGYHWQPNPARIFPAFQVLSSDTQFLSRTGTIENTATGLGAALKANPVAANDFLARVSAQAGPARAYGLLILSAAGYDIEPTLKAMSESERNSFMQHPDLPDPFDFTHVEDIGTRLDMLWGKFMMTGNIAPIQQIVSALKWRSDWDDFEKARKSANPPKEWTPSIGRALGYGAAGWSLGSFERSDPLAADYIQYILASPDTSAEVKAELKGLLTNPAFKRN